MSVAAVAAASRGSLDHPLQDEAELWIAQPEAEAIVLGAFGRSHGETAPFVVRRGSGGPAVHVGTGTLWVSLLLPRVAALVACDESKIVNRYVRPLLRALTRCGAQAHFFGRDWVSVKHRPAAWVGFAHDRGSGRATLEAIIAGSTPFEVGPRPSFLGKVPATLDEVTGRPLDLQRLSDAIVASYADAYGRAAVDRGAIPLFPTTRADDVRDEPTWAATVEEAIGLLGAGPDARGVFRLGGELLVSRDVLASLETELANAPDDALGRLIDAALTQPGVALEGVRSLESIRDVVARSRR